jgi:hypothetical protein
MSLIINGTERDELIIGKSVYRYIGEYAKVATANANTHNATYRGQSLGSFNETFASDIKDGTFNNMWVGDYFVVNNHTYKIAGFNYKCGHEENTGLTNHLIMITDVLSSQAMNSTNTTAGGFAGTKLFKNYFPQIESQLQTDFGNHLLTFKSYLSTSIDSNGAPNNGQWYSLKACMCNSAMWWGKPSQYSNNANGAKFNLGDETEQLPIMKLHTAEQSSGGNWVWLRDIYNSSGFADAIDDGSAAWDAAGDSGDVRAFFLID